ncbi:MAG: restriction endonuclease [Clostridiaceae bacterium]|nr:restriction endonuclease [Clostridiaceae bacterium]
MPGKETIAEAIVALASKEPEKKWERKILINSSISCYGFSSKELNDKSCESLSTKLKSLTGVVINELLADSVLALDDDGDISLKIVPITSKEITELFIKKFLTEDEAKDSRPDGKKNVLKAVLGQIIKRKTEDDSILRQGAKVVIEIEDELVKNDKIKKLILASESAYPNTPVGKLLKLSNDNYKAYHSGKVKLPAYETALQRLVTSCISEAGGEFFELLSMKLFRTVYGSSVVKDELTAGPDDNGIDGILTVKDGLGFLDTVFFQSKTKLRTVAYVSIKVVREFLGVVTAYRASKGILISNANFARETKLFASRAPNLMLVDNQQLFTLMKEYEVGLVKEGDTYVIDDMMFLDGV